MKNNMRLKDVPKNDFFKRKPDAKKVYIRGEYDRSTKTFECTDTEDINRAIYLKGSTMVFSGIELTY